RRSRARADAPAGDLLQPASHGPQAPVAAAQRCDALPQPPPATGVDPGERLGVLRRLRLSTPEVGPHPAELTAQPVQLGPPRRGRLLGFIEPLDEVRLPQ